MANCPRSPQPTTQAASPNWTRDSRTPFITMRAIVWNAASCAPTPWGGDHHTVGRGVAAAHTAARGKAGGCVHQEPAGVRGRGHDTLARPERAAVSGLLHDPDAAVARRERVADVGGPRRVAAREVPRVRGHLGAGAHQAPLAPYQRLPRPRRWQDRLLQTHLPRCREDQPPGLALRHQARPPSSCCRPVRHGRAAAMTPTWRRAGSLTLPCAKYVSPWRRSPALGGEGWAR